ncbi:MAG: signal peptide peptidase SppA [Alphaproteobacteria bacterium]|nr:signal peptide peptidase SppA [Alphaproteobacteria bacterium]
MKRFFIGFLSSIGAIVVIIAISVIILVLQRQRAEVPESTVLLLNFSNELAENQESEGLSAIVGDGKNSLKQIVDAIDTASHDDRVIGIVARLDHASMGMAQAQEIRDAVARFRAANQDKGKFTIAHADTFGELGPGTLQYYLATSFAEIWMQPFGTLGLTGILIEVPFAREALDKLELKPRIDNRKEFKSYSEMFMKKDFTPANKEAVDGIITSLIGQIIKGISVSRELPEVEIKDIIDQAPLLGKEGHQQGLIDRIAYFDEIKNFIEEKIEGETHTFMSPSKYLKLNPKKSPRLGESKIAIIYGVGEIYRDTNDVRPNPFNVGEMGGNQVAHAFQLAIDDPDVKAIVFRINSPGGSPVASETIWRATMRAKEAGKPVIVSMSDTAGSGGYWIATHATKIVAHPATITGSIGVLGGKIVTQGLWEKLGVHWGGRHSGANSTMWSSTQDYTPQEWQRLQVWLDEVYDTFIQKVAEGRKLSLAHVEQIAKGRIWTGEDALKFGLVDKLGDLNTAIELAKNEINLQGNIVPVEVFPAPESLTDKVLRLILGEEDETGTNGNVSLLGWVPGLKSVLSFLKTLERMMQSPQHVVGMPLYEVKG